MFVFNDLQYKLKAGFTFIKQKVQERNITALNVKNWRHLYLKTIPIPKLNRLTTRHIDCFSRS